MPACFMDFVCAAVRASGFHLAENKTFKSIAYRLGRAMFQAMGAFRVTGCILLRKLSYNRQNILCDRILCTYSIKCQVILLVT